MYLSDNRLIPDNLIKVVKTKENYQEPTLVTMSVDMVGFLCLSDLTEKSKTEKFNEGQYTEIY